MIGKTTFTVLALVTALHAQKIELKKGTKHRQFSQEQIIQIQTRYQLALEEFKPKARIYNWLSYFQPLKQVITLTPTEYDFTDWNFLYIPLYFEDSSTATNCVLSTYHNMIYVEYTGCTTCQGAGKITFGGTVSSSSFTTQLKNPEIDVNGFYSDNTVTVSFDAFAQKTTTQFDDSMIVGLISSYSGKNYLPSFTWNGDTNVDGIFGLAVDPNNPQNNFLKEIQSYYFNRRYFTIDVQLGDTSTFTLAQVSAAPQWQQSISTSLYAANIEGFMVTSTPSQSVLTTSFQLPATFGYIDTSSRETWIPSTYYEIVMKELMKASVGYYYDTDLETYVLGCDQYDLFDDLYFKFADNGFLDQNLWFSMQASDFFSEIYETGLCQIQIKSNPDNEWIFGLNFLNQYTLDFDIETISFSIVNYNTIKSFSSTQIAFEPYDLAATNTTPWLEIGIQTLMSGIFSWQVWHHFIYNGRKTRINESEANNKTASL